MDGDAQGLGFVSHVHHNDHRNAFGRNLRQQVELTVGLRGVHHEQNQIWPLRFQIGGDHLFIF